MSTNFYVRLVTDAPGDEGIHLGKSSAGWPFLFHAYPDAARRPAEITWDVVDFDSWSLLLNLGTVVTEYGDPVSLAELAEKISDSRRFKHDHAPGATGDFEDSAGNRFAVGEFC